MSVPPKHLDDDASSLLTPQSWVFTGVPAGSYAFTETAVLGWDLTSIVCTGDTGVQIDLNKMKAAIDLNGSENVTCTFTNTKQGSIKVAKDVVPDDNQSTQWNFAISGPTANSVNLYDAQNSSVYLSKPGNYSIVETAVAPTLLANYATTWSCSTAAASLPDGTGTTATFTLAAGANVTCTFTNTKLGSITFVKDAQPNDARDFAFTTTGTGL